MAPIADSEIPLGPFFVIPVRVVMKIRGKFHTAKLLVGSIGLFLDGIPKQRRRNECLNAHDFIPIIDGPLDPELADRISEDLPLLSETALAGRAAFIPLKRYQVLRRHRTFEETVRVEPDLELPGLRGSRLWIDVRPLQIPSIIAAHEVDLPLFPLERNAPAAALRVVPLPPNLLFSHGSGVEVDGPGEIRQLHFWPVIAGGVTLAHDADIATGARIGDALQRIGAH